MLSTFSKKILKLAASAVFFAGAVQTAPFFLPPKIIHVKNEIFSRKPYLFANPSDSISVTFRYTNENFKIQRCFWYYLITYDEHYKADDMSFHGVYFYDESIIQQTMMTFRRPKICVDGVPLIQS